MKIKFTVIITALSFSSSLIKAQATDGNPITGNLWAAGEYLGWNASSGNNALQINTSNLNRFLIRQNGFGAFMQNYPGAPLTNPLPGFRQTRIGISRDGLNPVLFPQSLLHLGYDSPLATQDLQSCG